MKLFDEELEVDFCKQRLSSLKCKLGKFMGSYEVKIWMIKFAEFVRNQEYKI